MKEQKHRSFAKNSRKNFMRWSVTLRTRRHCVRILKRLIRITVSRCWSIMRGVGYYGLHEELNPKKIQKMVRTNLEAPMILTQQLLRTLKKEQGDSLKYILCYGSAVQSARLCIRCDKGRAVRLCKEPV
ncbi:MAG: hypothetical protein ACLRWA_00310 [Lachnospira sp.]